MKRKKPTGVGKPTHFAAPVIECNARCCGKCRYLGAKYSEAMSKEVYTCHAWKMPLVVDPVQGEVAEGHGTSEDRLIREAAKETRVLRCQECKEHERRRKKGPRGKYVSNRTEIWD